MKRINRDRLYIGKFNTIDYNFRKNGQKLVLSLQYCKEYYKAYIYKETGKDYLHSQEILAVDNLVIDQEGSSEKGWKIVDEFLNRFLTTTTPYAE